MSLYQPKYFPLKNVGENINIENNINPPRQLKTLLEKSYFAYLSSFSYLHFLLSPSSFLLFYRFFIYTIDILPFLRLAPLAFVKAEGGKLYA